MPLFQYKALTTESVVAEGQIDAGGRQEALRQLQSRGLRPIRLGEPTTTARTRGHQAGETAESATDRKVSFRSLENFTRQLSSLLAGGVPLSRALHLVARESSSPAAAKQWRAIHDMVIEGLPLADAMARLPRTFPRVYVAMVQAGEAGGFLDVVLGQIADFQAREKELRSRVISALIYPAVLLTLACGVLVFLLTFFIPRFQKIFAGFGVALPILTRIILAASDFTIHYGPLVLVALAVGTYAFRQWILSVHGRRVWENALMRLPVLGPFQARFAMTRFCRMLGTLTRSGVPLIGALRVARESLGNRILVDALNHSIERVQQGHPLAASLADCSKLFPGSIIEMISIAEESGRLDEELVRLADVTERDLDSQLRTIVALAEPLLLFLLAGFIGTIFVGMVLPIFTIQDYIK